MNYRVDYKYLVNNFIRYCQKQKLINVILRRFLLCRPVIELCFKKKVLALLFFSMCQLLPVYQSVLTYPPPPPLFPRSVCYHDATVLVRFINHSCEPNCYSKIVDILGKKHIIIFSLRLAARKRQQTVKLNINYTNLGPGPTRPKNWKMNKKNWLIKL